MTNVKISLETTLELLNKKNDLVIIIIRLKTIPKHVDQL